jgi:uncharacterized membrane protein
MTIILREFLTSKTREDNLFASVYLKELGLLLYRVYLIEKKPEHLLILNDLALFIKKYEITRKIY